MVQVLAMFPTMGTGVGACPRTFASGYFAPVALRGLRGGGPPAPRNQNLLGQSRHQGGLTVARAVERTAIESEGI